jgi:phenylacetate-CoA ligase
MHVGLRLVMWLYHLALAPAARLGRWFRHRTDSAAGYDILLTGTFYSDNWIASHVRPLAAVQGCRRIWIVSTYPVPNIPNVVAVCPSRRLQKLIGPVPARLLTFIWTALRRRPAFVGGFHLLVNGLVAGFMARLIGARSIYFCVGGPTEVLDGGVRGENRLFSQMETPDPVVERHLIRAVGAFDLVVTMGTTAVDFFRRHGVRTRFQVVSGGIDASRFEPCDSAPVIDLILIGRLARVKRIDRFLEAVRLVAEACPHVKAAIIGDGELRQPLEQLAGQLGLADTVSFVGHQRDVEQWLKRARLFVLTSDSEGLSLALMEAMMCGLPAVVSDVGDLRDLVQHGVNGYLVPTGSARAFATQIINLLTNEQRRRAFSRAARQAALRHETGAVTRRWAEILNGHTAPHEPTQISDGQVPDTAVANASDRLTGGSITPFSPAQRLPENGFQDKPPSSRILVPRITSNRVRSAMKLALSRKNLWENLPPPVKSGVGGCLGWFPLSWLLGSRWRAQLGWLGAAQWWPAERSREYQLARLRDICTLAQQRTRFYRELFDAAGFDPRDLRTPEDLDGLPTISKDTLRAHLDDMCTVSPHAPGVDRVSTGGTAGTPLHFYIGTGRSVIEFAYLVASWARAGFAAGMPLAVFRGRIVHEDARGLRHAYDPLLRQHHYSNFHMTDANMRRYLEHVRTIGPCFLHVYPSSADALARFIRRSGMAAPTNVRGVIAESEIVFDAQRRLAEEVFGCHYFSCYGHSEKLVLAAECEHSHDYHVWPTYGYVELLDGAGHPIDTPGERGEIVATGFINRVVPFIRYRTGDFATYVDDHCSACGREHMLLRDIRGHRTQEMLVAADGTLISWTALNMHDDTFERVVEFQFYQDTPGRAVLYVVPAAGFGESDHRRMMANLRRKLTARVELTMKLTDAIPRSPRGKAVYVDQRLPIREYDELVSVT